MSEISALRVGVIGYGAIGRVVARNLADGDVSGAALSGVLSRSPIADGDIPQATLAELLNASDLIVEAAGQGAVVEYGEQVLRSGVDLLVVSVGALSDETVAAGLNTTGPGRVFYASGAIGGLDLLVAARRLGPFDEVRLTTTKLPNTLVQPWMDAVEVDRLRAATTPIDVYRGTARGVASRFPKSTNVAAGLAIACQGWDSVEVVVRADPQATLTSHVIEASSPHGSYRFEIRNLPDEQNPATSKVVPFAVLRSVAALARSRGSVL